MNELKTGAAAQEGSQSNQNPASLKPGAMTSEFWLIVASLTMSATLDCLGKLPTPWLAIASIALPVVFASLRTLAKNEHAGRLHDFALTLLEAQEERLKGMMGEVATSSDNRSTTDANEEAGK